jgi:hypothetical protein
MANREPEYNHYSPLPFFLEVISKIITRHCEEGKAVPQHGWKRTFYLGDWFAPLAMTNGAGIFETGLVYS